MGHFPVGYVQFHSNEAINFQMNRWYSSGCIEFDELMLAGERIHNFEEWTKEFCELADDARDCGDLLAYATYLRAAQFFTIGDKTDDNGQLEKVALYERCIGAYEAAYEDENITYERIPFKDGYLPVLYKLHEKQAKGTIVIHGGYDSFIQEFIPYLLYIYEHGYNVYLFEGSGQGEVLNRCNIKMTHEWETCTTPILDYFGLEDVTLIGVSLGGYLAARAAAYETRIKRVVLYDIIYDFYGAIMSKKSALSKSLMNQMMKFPSLRIWNYFEKQMEKEFFSAWLLHQGYYVFGVQTLPDYLNCIKKYTTKEISKLIKQDVLLLAGESDLYTIYFEDQKKALTNAKSVTGRIFTEAEQAAHHCQIGNITLVLDYILEWIADVS